MATTTTSTPAATDQHLESNNVTTSLSPDTADTTSPGRSDSNHPVVYQTGREIRLACRAGAHNNPTAGHAAGHLQANLIVLPARFAGDFRRLCARNPVACPLLAESARPGDWAGVRSCVPDVLPDHAFVGGEGDFDVRTDLPAYNIYRQGKLIESHVPSLKPHWNAEGEDHIAFLIGCSFSFESALCAAGLPPAHTTARKNVPMYRTTLPLHPAGVFTGANHVVSMRPYPLVDVQRVREITASFGATHGEPIAWGWEAVGRLGIRDIDSPDWGDAAVSRKGKGGGLLGQMSWGSEEEVPVFWGCGVTPQEAVMRAGKEIEGVVMGHAPGHMLVLDAKDEDLCRGST